MKINTRATLLSTLVYCLFLFSCSQESGKQSEMNPSGTGDTGQTTGMASALTASQENYLASVDEEIMEDIDEELLEDDYDFEINDELDLSLIDGENDEELFDEVIEETEAAMKREQQRQAETADGSLPTDFSLIWPSDFNKDVDDNDPDPEHNEFVRVDSEPVPINLDTYLGKITYPRDAKEEGVKGTVYLKLLINKDGRAKDYHIRRSPDNRLTKAVLEQMKYVKYKPATLNGKPVKDWVNINYEFK